MIVSTVEMLNHLFDIHPGLDQDVYANLQDSVYKTPALEGVKALYDSVLQSRRFQPVSPAELNVR